MSVEGRNSREKGFARVAHESETAGNRCNLGDGGVFDLVPIFHSRLPRWEALHRQNLIFMQGLRM